MKQSKKHTLLLTLSGVIIVVGLIYTLSDVHKYSLPGSADMPEVKARVIPALQEDLRKQGMTYGSDIFIRIFKESRELEMWLKIDKRYRHFKTYPICAYSGTLGPKLKEGDQQAPEGFYTVNSSAMNPESAYHLSFNLGFPNIYDAGHNRTGSYLMVHGNCFSVGCYAMTDKGIEEIYLLAQAALDRGQTAFNVHVFPFRMTKDNMRRHKDSQWFSFWKNLQIGYEAFLRTGIPPTITVADRKYIVNP